MKMDMGLHDMMYMMHKYLTLCANKYIYYIFRCQFFCIFFLY